jgi:hypothetical protein
MVEEEQGLGLVCRVLPSQVRPATTFSVRAHGQTDRLTAIFPITQPDQG